MIKKKTAVNIKTISTVVRFERKSDINNYNRLKDIGKDNDRSANYMINLAISEYVNKKVKP